ncbi:MAG: dienelactone hydrolase family protein [Acidobacteria bacterium]|nr:dienelactone hydrolase family protein [Acidobacteriota bacterium]
MTTTTGSKGVMVRPIGDGPFPAVLHLHGSGDTAAANVEALRIFARAGYVALDVDYRGVGSGSIDIQDIYKSLEFLNASRHVRQGAIGLNGFSLGGRLALRIATQRRVLAVSAIAARTTSGSTPTVLAQAERLTVPILLQHGTEDSVVPYGDAVVLEKKLRALGRPVELISYPGVDHGNLPWPQVYARVLEFFRTTLR